MTDTLKHSLLFAVVAVLILLEGLTNWSFFSGSWNSSLVILNMGLISAIMALGVNLQWGFAGLFNVGIMGFTALGGLAVVLTSTPPSPGAWSAGGPGVVMALVMGALTVISAVATTRLLPKGGLRTALIVAILIVGFVIYRALFDPSIEAIEDINPALAGNIGGLGWPVLLSWPMGGLLAAGAAWLIGKTALGLRSDYLAIATL
ncbi:MAG: branched-chain amino acid ABC transporter permease, partial [Pseudophaeobacter sp.]